MIPFTKGKKEQKRTTLLKEKALDFSARVHRNAETSREPDISDSMARTGNKHIDLKSSL